MLIDLVLYCVIQKEKKIKYNIFYEEEGEIEAKLIKEILNELNPVNILTSIYKVNNL